MFILGFWTFLTLMILKLTEVIDWTWFVVTCPLWIGAIIDIIIILLWVAGVFALERKYK